MLEKNLKITLTNFSVEKCTEKNRSDAPLGRAAPVKLEGNASAIFGSVLPDRKTTEQRLEPGCNGEGEKREKEKKSSARECRLRGVYDLFFEKWCPKKLP